MNICSVLRVWWSLGPWRLGITAVAVFGFLGGAIQFYALFVPNKVPQDWRYFVAFVISSVLIAAFYQWPRLRLTGRLNLPNTEIEIKVGDLFDEPGYLIIGTNDCFDTEIGDVINQKSVQGQFQTRMYGGDQRLVDTEIEAALHLFRDSRHIDSNKTRGKPWRYPIGTAIVIGNGTRRYFLTAYTRMGNNLMCESDAASILTALDRLWDVIREKANGGPVAIPVIGPELARTGLPRMELLKMIVLSFILATRRRKVITKKLTVVVHPKDLQDVDLYAVKVFLKAVLA